MIYYLFKLRKYSSYKINFLIIILFYFPFFLLSQNRAVLEKEKNKLKKDIELVNKLLEDSEKKSKISEFQVNTLQKKIEIRENFIGKISSEIILINKKIDDLKEKSFFLKSNLKELTHNYEQTVISAYKYKSYSKYNLLLFLISSQNIFQFFKRTVYIKNVLDKQQDRANKIKALNQEYISTIRELEYKISVKKSLLTSENAEKEILVSEKEKERSLIHILSKEKVNLKNTLAEKEKQTKELEYKIKEVIVKEVALQKRKESTKKHDNKEFLSLTKDFESQKGKLPYPAKNIFLYMGYGKQNDPILTGIKRDNPYITLGTTKDAEVYSIFQGEVSSVMLIPGNNILIIIKHGDYFTSYSNLSKVFVKQGDKVKQNQKIGIVFYDENENKSLLKISIFSGIKQLDPTEWIYRLK